jgi:predicted transcriptional regulator
MKTSIKKRKMNIIEHVMFTDNTHLIKKIEKLVEEAFDEEHQSKDEHELIQKAILKSEEDIKNGNFLTQEELENEIKNW